jgi:hypothetical protein
MLANFAKECVVLATLHLGIGIYINKMYGPEAKKKRPGGRLLDVVVTEVSGTICGPKTCRSVPDTIGSHQKNLYCAPNLK